jgi:hypothetical protein
VINTNRVTLVIAGLAALFSLISLISSLSKSGKTQVPELQETNNILQRQAKLLDSLLQNRAYFPGTDSLNKRKH